MYKHTLHAVAVRCDISADLSGDGLETVSKHGIIESIPSYSAEHVKKSHKQRRIDMKTEIRYFTKTGNTKKLAEAIAAELGTEAKDLSVPLSEKTDILFLCSSVYWAGADSSVKKYIKDNAGKIGTLVNVSTAAMIESTYSQVKKVCEQSDVAISDKEFHCRGKFAAMHSGHPDDADIQVVKDFARRVTRES